AIDHVAVVVDVARALAVLVVGAEVDRACAGADRAERLLLGKFARVFGPLPARRVLIVVAGDRSFDPHHLGPLPFRLPPAVEPLARISDLMPERNVVVFAHRRPPVCGYRWSFISVARLCLEPLSCVLDRPGLEPIGRVPEYPFEL